MSCGLLWTRRTSPSPSFSAGSLNYIARTKIATPVLSSTSLPFITYKQVFVFISILVCLIVLIQWTANPNTPSEQLVIMEAFLEAHTISQVDSNIEQTHSADCDIVHPSPDARNGKSRRRTHRARRPNQASRHLHIPSWCCWRRSTRW